MVPGALVHHKALCLQLVQYLQLALCVQLVIPAAGSVLQLALYLLQVARGAQPAMYSMLALYL